MKFSFFHQRHALSTSFDIFVVTYRVTNFLLKLLDMLLFLGKKLNFHFFEIPYFRVLPVLWGHLKIYIQFIWSKRHVANEKMAFDGKLFFLTGSCRQAANYFKCPCVDVLLLTHTVVPFGSGGHPPWTEGTLQPENKQAEHSQKEAIAFFGPEAVDSSKLHGAILPG